VIEQAIADKGQLLRLSSAKNYPGDLHARSSGAIRGDGRDSCPLTDSRHSATARDQAANVDGKFS